MNERTRDSLLFLVLAGGFATMAVEVRYLHREVLREEWQAAIPVVFSAVATVALLLGLSASKWARGLVAFVMGAGVLIGMYGTFLHSEGEASAFQRLLAAAVVARADDDEHEGKEGRESEEEPPVLAPMGIAGLSAVGFLLAVPTKRRGY
jgi:hypothetical protein